MLSLKKNILQTFLSFFTLKFKGNWRFISGLTPIQASDSETQAKIIWLIIAARGEQDQQLLRLKIYYRLQSRNFGHSTTYIVIIQPLKVTK